MVNHHWHTSFFSNLYAELFLNRTQEEIYQHIQLIESLVDMKKMKTIMDVCCGLGDICHTLASKHNLQDFGIEYSPEYVKKNKIKNIIEGDARKLQTKDKFSLVLNWYSSFSYFDKCDNYKILKNCFTYTEDTFLLETANIAHLINNFKSHIQYTKKAGGKIYLVDRLSRLNLSENTIEQDFIFFDGVMKDVNNTRSYIYFPKDICDDLYDIGFRKVEMFGVKNASICDLDMECPRLIIKATK